MLTRAEHPVFDREREGPRVTARHALWALIGVSTILRLVWAASLGALFDEPYYFQYIHHPSLSYFSTHSADGRSSRQAALGSRLNWRTLSRFSACGSALSSFLP